MEASRNKDERKRSGRRRERGSTGERGRDQHEILTVELQKSQVSKVVETMNGTAAISRAEKTREKNKRRKQKTEEKK